MLLSTQVEFQSLRRLPAQTKHESYLLTGGANVTQSCALCTAHTHMDISHTYLDFTTANAVKPQGS